MIRVLFLFSVLAMTIHNAAAESPDSPATRLPALMQMKLDKAKAILEGLATEDYDQVGANARSLRLLSTESGWNVIQTEEYVMQSRDFRRAAASIAEAAEDRDINRAALGYVSLTVRCVECHSYMRKHGLKATRPDVTVGESE